MYEMKESGIKWIGQIPKHWEVRKVKHIGKLISGVGFPISYQGFYEYEIPFYKVNSLSTSEKYIEIKTDTISESMVASLGAKKIQPNSILFAKVGAALLLNRFRINKYQCCIDNNMSSLSLHKHSILEYIYFAFSLFDFKYIVNNGAIPSINETQIYSVKFPFPPLDEQKKIADFLDKKVSEIENLIYDTKKLIEKYRGYKQSIITETVTKGLNSNVEMKESGIEWIGQIPKHWEVSRLKYLCDFRKRKNTQNITMRYIGLENIESYTGKYKATKSEYSLIDAIICQTNDIIFGKLRPYLSKAYIVDEMSCCSSEFIVLYNIGNVKFIFFLLLSKGFIDSMTQIAYGAKMPRVSDDDILNFNFPLPPLNEQEEIAKYLDDKCSQIDNIIEEKQLSLEKLEEYKKSLIYEYVTGKKQVENE